jgi:hypothetical protein
MLHLVTNNIITKRDSGNGIMLVQHKYMSYLELQLLLKYFSIGKEYNLQSNAE